MLKSWKLSGLQIGLVVLGILSLALPAVAQSSDKPDKAEVFAGYSFLSPGGNLFGTQINNAPAGFEIASTYFFNKFWGGTVDSAAHFGDHYTISTIQIGPTFRYPMAKFTPFAHFLTGLHRAAYPGEPISNKMSITPGAGLDLKLPNKWINLRLIQVDYQWAQHDYKAPFPVQSVHNDGVRLSSGIVFKFGGAEAPVIPPS